MHHRKKPDKLVLGILNSFLQFPENISTGSYPEKFAIHSYFIFCALCRKLFKLKRVDLNFFTSHFKEGL